MTLPSTQDLAALDDATLVALRARLVDAGYTPALHAEAESILPMPVRRPRLPVVRGVLARRGTDAADLLRLFAYEDALPRARVDALLGEAARRALCAAGVLATTGEGPDALASNYLITPLQEGVQVVSDHLRGDADAVMGPSSGTSLLAGLIPSEPGSVLDVGCGAGSLALVAAARGARRAVGVDVNARALALARVNARLNAVRAEFLRGDLTRPVAGARFDVVVSQPAFAPRPDEGAAVTYLHGGVAGDELAQRVLEEVPAVLAPGGRAVVLSLVPAREGSLSQRLRARLGDAPCDLVVLRMQAPSLPLQAAAFASYEAGDLGAAYEAGVARYLRHFDALGVREAEGVLAVVSRHAEGDEAPGGHYTLALPCEAATIEPAELDAMIARLEALRSGDDALAKLRVRVAPRLRLATEQEGVRAGAKGVARAQFARGSLGVAGELTAAQVEILRALDAAGTAERAAAAVAKARRAPPNAVRGEVLEFVRHALMRGRIVPAE